MHMIEVKYTLSLTDILNLFKKKNHKCKVHLYRRV